MQIEVAGIPVELEKKNIRNIYIRVKPPDGKVYVTAPRLTGMITIRRFVESRADWIRAQQRKYEDARREAEGKFCLFGKKYELITERGGKRNSIIIEEDTAKLTVRDGCTDESLDRWINEWYRERLKEQIEKILPVWEEKSGLHPSGWQTKNMTSRWGTCNTKTRKIWINLQLAKKPLPCLEYVIMHELAHLKVPNHGRDFKAILDRNMPDWRERKKLLA